MVIDGQREKLHDVEAEITYAMFEISGNDITVLNDVDLRSLVVRLTVAELRTKGYPISSVMAGGNQDAADGGLDVRIECSREITDPDFVPRRLTGFQVKKPDMSPAAIRGEMRPKDILRSVIREIADAAGAYVIISAQGSVADKPLADRRKAMRDVLHDLAAATQLHTDFYDRDRLAIWINEYPGIAAWVRRRVGRPLAGWSSIDDWEGGSSGASKSYLVDEKACLIDECSQRPECRTIERGIVQLRSALREPAKCVRLVGLSGLGKTRLVRALFEPSVGEDPLDPGVAVYTDYSEETDPTARDMARDLIARDQRAILIVDNCNPATHAELARLCSAEGSKVSLITIEYDVRDDEPEHTEVFRLQSVSSELVAQWVEREFPNVSQVDRTKIAEFSDGNFRVARALAETLHKRETLAHLKNSDLFERIFQQRHSPDQSLLRDAEDLSLFYSIDGEDISAEGELARAGTIRQRGAQPLYEALVEMHRRGVVQARGRYRAILPHAIANPLAVRALERIPPAAFDRFCQALPFRMFKSLTRRLGFLHDSAEAQATVTRWLRTDGPLGNLIATDDGDIQIVINLAPVAPAAVLTRLNHELTGPNGHLVVANLHKRHQWVGLIRAIGYDASLFDDAAMILARFLAAEPEAYHSNSAHAGFSEFFHLYLSGTEASPEQRCAVIKRLAKTDDHALRNCAQVALDAMLKVDHFMSTHSLDFGARSRGWGWQPKFNVEVDAWYEEAIALVVEYVPEAEARALIAKNIHGLWRYPTCRNALDRVAATFIEHRPWIEGWLALRSLLRYRGKDMPEDVRATLSQLIGRLKPHDLLNQARAVVLNRMNGGWDASDGEDDDGDVMKALEKTNLMAHEIGRALANDAESRREFLTELLVEAQPIRAAECGRGMAEGAEDLDVLWRELVDVYAMAESGRRNPTTLGGFIYGANQRDQHFASLALEKAIDNPILAPDLPYLQIHAGIDEAGIARLRRAIARGVLSAANFCRIANGSVTNSPPESLASLLEDIAGLPDGVGVAIEILHMHFFRHQEGVPTQNARLVAVGRDLLARADFSEKKGALSDFSAHRLICICLAGEEARPTAEKLCMDIRSALDSYHVSSYNLSHVLKALFETQPFIALDTFLLSVSPDSGLRLFDRDLHMGTPFDNMSPTTLQEWADHDPDVRYELLGGHLSMFGRKHGEEVIELCPLFLTMLDHAPDKRRFLGSFYDRLHPRSWSGSLADTLIRRKSKVTELAKHADAQVRDWVSENTPDIDRWIEHERGRDRASEESFE